MIKKKIKQKIEEFEYFYNGFHHLNGRSVKATRIRERADKMYIADIQFINDEDRKYELIKDCEYPVDKFGPEGGKK